MHTKTEKQQPIASNLTEVLDIEGLPSLIIDYFSPLETPVIARVNTQFHELTNDQNFWKKCIKKHFPKYYESHIEILTELPETKESKSTVDYKKIYIELYKKQNNSYYKMLWDCDDRPGYYDAIEPPDVIDNDYDSDYWKDSLETWIPEFQITETTDCRITYIKKFREDYAIHLKSLWLIKEITQNSVFIVEKSEEENQLKESLYEQNKILTELINHTSWGNDNGLLSAVINTKNQKLQNNIYSFIKECFTNTSGELLIEAPDTHGRTLLFWAAVLNQATEEIDKLIELGADINFRIFSQLTNDSREEVNGLLGFVVKYGHRDLYIHLKKRNAYYGDSTMPAIHLASQYGHTDLVKYLAEEDPSAIYSSESNSSDKNPFDFAAEHGQLDVLNMLFDIHYEILKPSPAGENRKFHLNLEKLPETKTVPNPIVKQAGFTALHYAAKAGHFAIIQRLRKEPGFDINSVVRYQGYDYTALHLALQQDSPLFIHYLLKLPGSNLENIHIKTILGNLASSDKFIDILKIFLQRKDCVWWGPIDSYNNNLLHISARNNAVNALNLLLETKKININSLNIHLETPLARALSSEFIACFKVLFQLHLSQLSNEPERNTFLNQMTYDYTDDCTTKFSFLGSAAAYNNVSLLKFLLPFYLPITASSLQKKSFFNQEFDNEGRNLLSIAVRFGRKEMIKWLLNNHADINAVDAQGFTPIFQSIAEFYDSFDKTFPLLISKGANLYQVSKNKKNLIHFLLGEQHNRIDADEILVAIIKATSAIKIKDFINQTQAEGKTPLHLAVENDLSSLIVILLETNVVNLEIRDQDGLTPLELAIKKRRWEVMSLLLHNGAKLNPQIFYDAIEKNDEETVEWLIYHIKDVTTQKNARPGLDFDTVTHNGLHPIHMAVLTGNITILSKIIAISSNINVLSQDGKTALFLAISVGNVAAVKTLLDHNANINIACKGVLPIQLAYENLDILEIFITQKLIAFEDQDKVLNKLKTLLSLNSGPSEKFEQIANLIQLLTEHIEKLSDFTSGVFADEPADHNLKRKREVEQQETAEEEQDIPLTDFFKARKAVLETKSSTQEKRKHEETEQSEVEKESASHKKPKKERPDRSHLLDPTL